jgi:hypothetical protein
VNRVPAGKLAAMAKLAAVRIISATAIIRFVFIEPLLIASSISKFGGRSGRV